MSEVMYKVSQEEVCILSQTRVSPGTGQGSCWVWRKCSEALDYLASADSGFLPAVALDYETPGSLEPINKGEAVSLQKR